MSRKSPSSPAHRKASAPAWSRPTGIATTGSWRHPARSSRAATRTSSPSRGDIGDPATAERVVKRGDVALRADRHAGQQCRHLHRQALHRLHGRGLRVEDRDQSRRLLPHHAARRGRDAEAGLRPHRQHHHEPCRSTRSPGVPTVLANLTKGGINSATKALAIEYAAKGIRVNAVSPGIIKTPMHPAETHEFLAGAPSGEAHGRDSRHRGGGPLPRVRRLRDRRDPPCRRRPERRSLEIPKSTKEDLWKRSAQH